MTSSMTALAFRSERRPRTLLAHTREDTSMVANSQTVVLFVADERAELISLQLNEVEVAQHPVVEVLRGR